MSTHMHACAPFLCMEKTETSSTDHASIDRDKKWDVRANNVNHRYVASTANLDVRKHEEYMQLAFFDTGRLGVALRGLSYGG